MSVKDPARVEESGVFVTAPDGLKLHVRSYGPRLAPRVPVVCLPGLTRTTADFHELARALAGDEITPRRVLSLDYRGRGLSEYDPNSDNYNLAVELGDLLTVLTALELPPAVFVGTSRGGLLTMMLAGARPTVIAGAILNDIGPVIEPAGLIRIKGYVGKLPQPKSFEEGAGMLQRLFGQQFTALSDSDWLAWSHRSFKAGDDGLVSNYDVDIAKTMEGIDFNNPLPPLWAEFDGLARTPLMVLRGENSDLLSAETVAAMAARRASMETVTVPGQGHAPVLSGRDMISRIARFVATCEPDRG